MTARRRSRAASTSIAASRPMVAAGDRVAAVGQTSSSWSASTAASRSSPCAAPRTARSTASVSPRSPAPPARSGGPSAGPRQPTALIDGVQGEPEPGVGAHRPRVARGQDHPAAGAVAVLPGQPEQLAADARRLRVGIHHQQRQAPQPLAHDRQRAADDPPVADRPPSSRRIGGEQAAQPHEVAVDRLVGRVARPAAGAGPAAARSPRTRRCSSAPPRACPSRGGGGRSRRRARP